MRRWPWAMGLANRVVDPGKAREEAERLATQIGAFPQRCLRSDREAVSAAWTWNYQLP